MNLMTRSNFFNTNTELPRLGYKLTFNELGRLKKLYLNENSECDENYVPIRLVTIIEHFFRTLLKRRLVNEPKFKPKITINYHLLLNSLNTAIQKCVDNDTVPESSLDEAIDRYANKNAMQAVPDRIEFDNAWVLDYLIEDVCGHYWWHGIREDIQASSVSFQNTHSIKEHFKAVFDVVDEEKYHKFFNIRHTLVHTLNAPDITIDDYFEMAEDLMLTALEQENGQEHWADFCRGIMAQNCKNETDAIDFFCRAANAGNEWAHLHLGFLLVDSKTEEAKQHLEFAVSLAYERVMNTRLLRPRMNTKINVELENYGSIVCSAMIVYDLMGDIKAEDECLFEAIEKASLFNGLYKSLALMLILFSRHGQAISCCEAGIASTRDYILKAQLYYWNARALIMSGDMMSAQDSLYKVLSIYPEYEPARNLLDDVLKKRNPTNAENTDSRN